MTLLRILIVSAVAVLLSLAGQAQAGWGYGPECGPGPCDVCGPPTLVERTVMCPTYVTESRTVRQRVYRTVQKEKTITVQRCERTPPEEPPESTVFLEIFEIRPDKDPTPLFRGWMFASSPALSALEHPVYDVWVLECKRTAPPPEAESGKNP